MKLQLVQRCKNLFTTFSPRVVREDVRMIIHLVEMNKDWQKDHYVWHHPSGISLWVGNISFAISVKWNARDRNDYVAIYAAGKWRLNAAEYRLVKRAMKKTHVDADDQKVRIVAARILEMYG